ncbi:unnamed protein product [Pleuronectes platessa]|uniref:Snf2-related CREBBP activator protein n=1 Tax=Pleuronectes platessa TaxID=8262 RepID=A0A9N7UP93_PLEPL|nr:unnamed protein product [Pleuronectes platessa]
MITRSHSARCCSYTPKAQLDPSVAWDVILVPHVVITLFTYCTSCDVLASAPSLLNILEVESTEDLCLTPQSGAVCSRGSTGEGSSEEEAARQLASPAVDLPGGNPQAAQDVAGESPRHAQQPVAAAPRPDPPLTIPSTVPLQKSEDSAFLGMENAPPTPLPESLPISCDSKDSVSDEVAAGSRSLPTSLRDDRSSSDEMQWLPAPLCPPLAPDTKFNSTEQELQYESQTEKSQSNCDTDQIQPLEEASTSSVPQSDADSTGHGAVEQSNRDSLLHTNQDSHISPSGAAWQADGHQDSKSLLPSSDSTLLKTSDSETQPPSAEILETPEARGKPHGLHTSGNASLLSSSAAGREDGEIQTSCDSPGGERVESSTREEHSDAAVSSSDITMLPESSSTQDSSSKPSAAPPLFDSSIVISLQAGQVVEAESSPPCDQLPPTQTPLVAELGDAQEIVVVQEEAHINEDWSNVHLKQSYIVQREDGSVCEAALVNELSSESKLYEERFEADVELDSQPVEVYEFCGLVEEVAEETVCASGSVQMSHSPGYEMNLFNALLENSEEFNVKQDLELHLGPSIHTINDSDTIIISQQPLPSPHDANQLQDLSNKQAGTSAQIVTTCPQVSATASDQTEVSKQQNVSGKLASTHCALSGTVSEECLAQTDSAAGSLCASVALSSRNDQATCSVNKTSVTAALPVEVQPSASSNITSQHEQTPTNKSDNEALTPTKTSTTESVTQETTPPRTPHTLHMHEGSEEREGVQSSSPNDPISQPDSMDVEDESEDMDQDDQTGDAEAHEGTSGQVSSPEEGSDEEPDADKTESEMNTSSSSLKVRQWIAERVAANSSPVSPSTSSSQPGASPTSDWALARREKSSPLRGPSGKFVSPGTVGSYSPSSVSPDPTTPQRPRGERHTDMAEQAKHEADIEHRTQAFKREGFWSMKRLTRLTEPTRPKVHWDYLCEEMQWLSADFAQERRWKRGVARKVVRMVMRHHEDLRQKEEKAKRDEHAKIRRVASSIAKEVRAFWSSVEKVVQYKQQSRLEEKRKKALDLQLDFIVGQTEKYSDLLSKSLAPNRPAETVVVTPPKPLPPPADEDDRDFEPPCEEEDDEETLDVEEQQEGNDAETHRREIELLKEEGMLPLDQLLSTLKLPQETVSEEECSDETSSSVEEEDGEFTANDEDAEDEEDTIADQEKVEGNLNHEEELDDLAKEGDMTVEELLEKYKGAYASDFEAPSASGSKASSDSEVSGDEEEETEEDESDVESNSSSSDSQGDSAENDESEKEVEENENEEERKKEISHIAATAESLQPKGYTLATAKVKTPIPFLLHGTLREYQHIGLDWLVTMYEKKLNGILADEMGLGKTIQTIALLAHLACEKGNWGPHLIIVPTSVMLNWEMELKRWCPGFKILTYFGSQKERKLKRQGWTKPNAFHTRLRNIKNFKSQRWQSLLNFNSHRRLLLTGTPLQNSLMELWSLMHFLMPHVFQSHREFKEWFSNPLTGMIEGSQEYNEGLVKRLHKVLRPFLLRRIKIDVEKQMPKKYEHVVRCRLSKRQRFLYDDFMAQATTRETLASGHFMSVINILMQLRKVCNHPNLFDPRPVQSPFITKPIVFHTASLVQEALEVSPLQRCDLSAFDLVGLESRVSRYQADVFLPRHKVSRQLIQEVLESPDPPPRPKPVRMKVNRMFQPPPKGDNRSLVLMNKPTCSVPPAAQTLKPAPVTELSSTPAHAPVVQQGTGVFCGLRPSSPPIHASCGSDCSEVQHAQASV